VDITDWAKLGFNRLLLSSLCIMNQFDT